LVGVGEITGLARANGEWESHGLGPLYELVEMVRWFAYNSPG
jgi:hypothetical protein